MRLKKILYAGTFFEASTSGARAHGLRDLGLDVTMLNTQHWTGRGAKVLRSLGYRTFATPAVAQMNLALLETARRIRPDVLFGDKLLWVYPATLRLLRRYCRYLVHYSTDDPFGKHDPTWLFKRSMGLYDLHLTTNRFNVTELARRSSVRTMRCGMGYCREIHFPNPPGKAAISGGFVFVGHREDHTEEFVLAIRKAGLPIQVWGGSWSRQSKDPELRRQGLLPQALYTPTIAAADIALCSLSRKNRNESTGRSFEIPAIGTCMLAERTAEHEYLYRDGESAIFFSDLEELTSKAKYYWSNEDKRRKIAKAGRERLLELGLSWEDHMRHEWPIIERLLVTGKEPEMGADDRPFWPGYRKGLPYSSSES